MAKNKITANDISEVSRFNINGTIGVSLGFETFKLRAQYIYSLTNILNKRNDQNLA
ncbi:hypothetical protein [Winogradskyella sp.]|uniref:hypothetical protein n=1 Tax=Winogradskyella sp. TaxID=1883156 RepID=UPI0025D3B4D6|nr:hypothetical protein [Winogradskyella sp.]